MNPSETICWIWKRQPAESLSPLLPQEERITTPLHHPFRQKTPPTNNTTAEIIQRAPSGYIVLHSTLTVKASWPVVLQICRNTELNSVTKDLFEIR